MTIQNIRNCYGCGLCVTVCPHNAIKIDLNDDGFYEPTMVNPELCTNCGLCYSVCSYINTHKDECYVPVSSYSAWSRDSDVRQKSTSGGVCYEVARFLISQGYNYCGVEYNPQKNRAEHILIHTIDDIKKTQGSKYIQSYTIDGFRAINRKEKNLIIGTPCQIASFRRYIQKFKCEDNFILVDFFCHGVPSRLLWEKYYSFHSSKLGIVSNVTWLNKLRGWKAGYCITIKNSQSTYKSSQCEGDVFFILFLGDACLGKACYDQCKFRYNSSLADIRIGDLWSKKIATDDLGTCATIAFTKKGDDVLKSCDIFLKEFSFEDVADGQMKSEILRPWYYWITKKILRTNYVFIASIASIVRLSRIINRRVLKLMTLLEKL
jgi:coenzyme F420-reducing hydrogenase beta subunit